MKPLKRETPAAEGNRGGRRSEKLGSYFILENTANITRPQYFSRLSRIAAAIVAALQSGAPR